MFTGIITHSGTIVACKRQAGDMRMTVQTAMPLENAAVGASIACSGVCLTVTGKTGNSFTADLSAETLRCTTAQDWQEGTVLNLERALVLGQELGGHIVTGHVDGIARIHAITPHQRAHELEIACPPEWQRLVAPKGSVCLDGISLTVNQVDDAAGTFRVMIIPHTWENTTLGHAVPGQRLNMEIDVLARYVARLQEAPRS